MSMALRTRCAGVNQDGKRCGKKAQGESLFCGTHQGQEGSGERVEEGASSSASGRSVSLGAVSSSEEPVVAGPDWTKAWVNTHVTLGSAEGRLKIEEWLVDNEFYSPELLSTIGEKDLPTEWVIGRKRALMLALGGDQERGDKTPRTAKKSVFVVDEGESEEETGILSKSSLYGISSLDGRLYSCDSKSGGFARMKEANFLIRVMDQGLFSAVVDNLVVDKLLIERLLFRSEPGLATAVGSTYQSLAGLRRLMGFPVYDNSDKLLLAILGKFELFDRSKLALQDFLRGVSTLFFGRSPTAEGRALICDALRGVEMFFRIVCDSSFEGSFRSVIRAFEADASLLDNFGDFFLSEELHRLLVLWSTDVRCEVRSKAFPLIDLSSPVGCALLLSAYGEQWVAGIDKLEAFPHSRFYGQGGVASRVVRRVVSGKLPMSTDREQARSSGVNRPVVVGPKKPCMHAVAELLGIISKSGTPHKCFRSAELCIGKHFLAIGELSSSDIADIFAAPPTALKAEVVKLLREKRGLTHTGAEGKK